MKNRIIGFILIFLAFTMNAKSQNYDEILKTIEDNNTEIQASKKFVESKAYEYKVENLPGGPSFSYGYFPDNSSVSGTKEVVEISQSFQMPCFYRNHKAYSKLRMGQDDMAHNAMKQNVLFEAKELLIDYTFRYKQLSIVDRRLKFAQDIYNAYLIRLETGDANALEVNKAKLHLMQVQRNDKDARNEILAIKEKLNLLNGGNQLDISINEYPIEDLIELDSLLFNVLENDLEVRFNQQAVKISEKRVKVIKNLQLPEISLGYGSETVADEKFKGVLVGLSIPLWSSKRSIQQSKLEAEYYSINNSAARNSKVSDIKVQYDKVNTLKANLESYETILSSVNSESLLKQSLDAGEISIIEFFTEMFYYYEVYDDFLEVEKDYYLALSELYKYKL